MAAATRSARRWVGGLLLASSLALLVATTRDGRRPSILLISIDTLRADHLGCYGYPRATSPFIDSVAAEGTLFENAMVPLPATDPSHASLLTGLHPLRHGVLTNAMRLAFEAETMAEVLAAQGYHTMGATAVAHLGREYGFDQGFAAFSEVRGKERRSASEVNASVDEMLAAHARDGQDAPFFLFVHYFDAHSPYEMRPRYAPVAPLPPGLAPRGSEDAESIEAYDSEVAFVDARIAQLVRRVETLGLAGDLLVCIVADHGEQFGEHGYSGGHADFYRETVRVPVVCRGPGIPKQRVGRVVSSMDLAPTLLQRAGARFTRPVDGRLNMLADAAAAPAERDLVVLGYPSYARSVQLIRDPWVYIRNLEQVYRDVHVQPLASVDTGLMARSGFREARAISRQADEASYPMPVLDFEPSAITVVVEPAEPACGASLKIRLEPRLTFTSRAIAFSGPLRLTYPVSRFDHTSIAISPRRCAGPVHFKYERLAEARPAGEAAVSAVFTDLLTARKDSTRDELFDFRSDEAMRRNLIDSPSSRAAAGALAQRLPVLFGEHRKGALHSDSRDATPAELELLRALGYLQ
jgi:arylsulfatase A-like enzyme